MKPKPLPKPPRERLQASPKPRLLPILLHRFSSFIAVYKQARTGIHRLRQPLKLLLKASLPLPFPLLPKASLLAWSLLGISLLLGLCSVFLLGVQLAQAGYIPPLDSPPPHATARESTPLESISRESTPKAPKETPAAKGLAPPSLAHTKPPTLPKPRESRSFTGSLTYANALEIARASLQAQDFTPARFWLYRAFLLRANAKEVWELYWHSYHEDRRASIADKLAAYELYLRAKKHYGF